MSSTQSRDSWQFPDLGHELAIIGAGLLAVAALAGACAGVAADVLWHRHRVSR